MLYVSSSSRVLFDERTRLADTRKGRGRRVFTLAEVAHRKALPLLSGGAAIVSLHDAFNIPRITTFAITTGSCT